MTKKRLSLVLLSILKYFGLFFLVCFAGLIIFVVYNFRDRHKDYRVDINRQAPGMVTVQAGFAAYPITPEVIDTWIDQKGNQQFRPREGDTFEDVSGTGRFDAVWMAGFQSNKPAKGIHDDLWARAMALDDGNTRMVWVVIDAIGFFADNVVDVRKALPDNLGVDYLIISATHTHSAPDLLGIYGPKKLKSGVNPDYLEYVKRQILVATESAVTSLRPARFRFAVDSLGAADMIADTRKPVVINPALHMMQAVDKKSGNTLGTLVLWDNHPETIWSGNSLITSDFPHYLREGIEKGIWWGDSLITPGLGGIAIFATGNIGGLMTTHPGVGIACMFEDTVYTEPTFQKVRAQGLKLAQLTIDALSSSDVVEISEGSIELRVRSIELSLKNRLFQIGLAAGVINRGMTSWMRFRSEIAFWRLGPASFLHHPGEMYPEIADGGIEAPTGQDFAIQPLEIPPLREIMPGQFRFIAGLSNDMIGYIIPKSQWDQGPPFTYDYENRPYGEINSLGPETGPVIHAALVDLIQVTDEHQYEPF